MKNLLAIILISTSLNSFASYFSEEENSVKSTITQPNNKEYSVYKMNLSGFAYIRSPDGNILIKNDKTGWYEMAMFYQVGFPSLISNGRKYKPTNKTFFVKNDKMRLTIWRSDLQVYVDYINS